MGKVDDEIARYSDEDGKADSFETVDGKGG
jgi:hypothetical protein